MKKNSKKVLIALTGCLMAFGGNCLPDNFWANLFANTVNTAAEETVRVFVLDPFLDSLDNNTE